MDELGLGAGAGWFFEPEVPVEPVLPELVLPEAVLPEKPELPREAESLLAEPELEVELSL